jgi:hypothetical protein
VEVLTYLRAAAAAKIAVALCNKLRKEKMLIILNLLTD